MGDVSDRLEVKVVAARGLGEVEGGDCNPFALVRCGAEEERTAVASATSASSRERLVIMTSAAAAAPGVVGIGASMRVHPMGQGLASPPARRAQ